MRRIAAILAPVGLALVALGARPASARLDHFSLVLDYTATGWSAECELGCSTPWAAKFSCKTACDARVDALGLVTLAEQRPADPRFAFTLERTADGVSAKSKTGTAWTTLTWGCASAPCRARVTEAGVSLLGH